MSVCLSVCQSIFVSGPRTAGWIGTGEYSFDAPERWKDDGNNFGPIGCTWHVPRAIVQTLAKKIVAQGAGQANGRIRLKLGGLIATMGGLSPWGGRRCGLFCTCNSHVKPDFIIPCPLAEQLGRSERGTHRWTRRNGGKTMVPFAERLVRSHCKGLQWRKLLQKLIAKRCVGNQWTDAESRQARPA